MQLFWKVHSRMGRCRINSFKICAGRITLSAQMFLDFLAVGVWYACFSRKKVLVFFPLPHNWQEFLFLLHSLSEMLNGHRKKKIPCSVKIRLFLLILWLGERKNSDISDFWVCELYWDKTVYYQRECFSREKGKKIHSVLLSLCRKCYWKLRVQGLPKFLEGHRLLSILCYYFLWLQIVLCLCTMQFSYVWRSTLLYPWNENAQMKLSSLLSC